MALDDAGAPARAREPTDPRYGTRARRVRARRRLGELIALDISPPLTSPVRDLWLPGAPFPLDYAWPQLRRALRASSREELEACEHALLAVVELAGWRLQHVPAEWLTSERLALTALAVRSHLGLTK